VLKEFRLVTNPQLVLLSFGGEARRSRDYTTKRSGSIVSESTKLKYIFVGDLPQAVYLLAYGILVNQSDNYCGGSLSSPIYIHIKD
jgi:hypothetical protein